MKKTRKIQLHVERKALRTLQTQELRQVDGALPQDPVPLLRQVDVALPQDPIPV